MFFIVAAVTDVLECYRRIVAVKHPRSVLSAPVKRGAESKGIGVMASPSSMNQSSERQRTAPSFEVKFQSLPFQSKSLVRQML